MKKFIVAILIISGTSQSHACAWEFLRQQMLRNNAPKKIVGIPDISYHNRNLILDSRTHYGLQTVTFDPFSKVRVDFRSYNTRFDNSAVFCRMENQCLRSYNVKFSIHAGGYRE